MRACVYACVRACVCVCVCMRVCERVCVRGGGGGGGLRVCEHARALHFVVSCMAPQRCL